MRLDPGQWVLPTCMLRETLWARARDSKEKHVTGSMEADPFRLVAMTFRLGITLFSLLGAFFL